MVVRSNTSVFRWKSERKRLRVQVNVHPLIFSISAQKRLNSGERRFSDRRHKHLWVHTSQEQIRASPVKWRNVRVCDCVVYRVRERRPVRSMRKDRLNGERRMTWCEKDNMLTTFETTAIEKIKMCINEPNKLQIYDG